MTCLIVSGGDYCSRPEGSFDCIIACDRGWEHAARMGVSPDLIVGDFDSSPLPADVSVPVITAPTRKDDTDTMLAVRQALDRGCREITIACAFGGRLDHTIANLQAGAFIVSHGGKARLLGENEEVLVFSGGTVRLPRRESCSLSLFALGGDCAGVTVEGAKFDCRDVTLSPAFPLGVSNVWESDAVTVSIRSGTLAVVMSRLRPGEHI